MGGLSVGVPRLVIGWREVRRNEEASRKRWRDKHRVRDAAASLRRYCRRLELGRERQRLWRWRRRAKLLSDGEALALFRKRRNEDACRRRAEKKMVSRL